MLLLKSMMHEHVYEREKNPPHPQRSPDVSSKITMWC